MPRELSIAHFASALGKSVGESEKHNLQTEVQAPTVRDGPRRDIAHGVDPAATRRFPVHLHFLWVPERQKIWLLLKNLQLGNSSSAYHKFKVQYVLTVSGILLFINLLCIYVGDLLPYDQWVSLGPLANVVLTSASNEEYIMLLKMMCLKKSNSRQVETKSWSIIVLNMSNKVASDTLKWILCNSIWYLY